MQTPLGKRLKDFEALSYRFHKGCVYLMEEWEKGERPETSPKLKKSLMMLESVIEPQIQRLSDELREDIPEGKVTSMFDEIKKKVYGRWSGKSGTGSIR